MKQLKGKLGWVGRVCVTLGLFSVMFLFPRVGSWANPFYVDVRELFENAREVILGWLIVAALVKMIGIGAAIWRWNLLLRGQGIRVPAQHLIGTFLVGRFIGIFLPSTLGLDAYRAYDIAHRAKETVGSLTVIAVEKITGFFTLALLVVLSSLVMLVAVPADQQLVSTYALELLLLVFCVPVVLAFLLLLRPVLFEKLLTLRFPGKARIEGKLSEVVSAVTAYGDRPLLLWGAALLGLVVHGATALMYFFNALAVRTSPWHLLFVGPLIIVATVIAPTVAGLGAREFTAKGLLGRVMGAKAVLVGHLGLWSAELLPAVLGGIILASRPAEYRPSVESQRLALDGAADPTASRVDGIGVEAVSERVNDESR
jgi:uncharacterized membrane protein YbhN (UPF0104 family)